MAIDTATKRYSILNFGRVPTFPLFVPSGTTVDAGDRSHLLNMYSGIALGEIVIPQTITLDGGTENYELASNYKAVTVYRGSASDNFFIISDVN